jgi:pimeloyl-ACP methyl ester carboxylesterase
MIFGLVHGAWHGAWCFDALVAELEARGHTAIAVDLPAGDLDAGAVRYAELVDAALPRGDDVILVGHSLAGLTIPLVAARRPVTHLVFLCALIPEPGLSLLDQMRAGGAIFIPEFGADPGRHRDPDGCTWWEPAAAVGAFYHDCADAQARAAAARLRRQSPLPSREPCPLAALPDVTCTSIVCQEDRAISPAWSRRAARARLGTEAVEMDGGHSPFLSRPGELAGLLAGFA